MGRIGRYANAATTVQWAPDELPAGAVAEVIALETPDRSSTSGTLYQPGGGARALVTLTHPRVDFSYHYLIPPLLRAGYAVWAQRLRSAGNDVSAVHEQLLIDVAAGTRYLRGRGFERIFLLGNSGGASLYCFYVQQSSRNSDERLKAAPSGLPVDLSVEMPTADGIVLLAPHPGQGDVLMNCIDPAVADEGNPLATVPELDLFDERNGFCLPPTSSSFDADFVLRYRRAQQERVARIDASMRELLREQRAQRAAGREGDATARRQALAGRFVVVHRTDADPRTIDMGLDPSRRDYGSIFGRRPDVTNFGATGFARLTTPQAWLSTWSGLSSRATLRLTAPDVRLPALLVAYTADNCVFPGDLEAIEAALGSPAVARVDVDGDHYGYRPGTETRLPETAEAIVGWLDAQL